MSANHSGSAGNVIKFVQTLLAEEDPSAVTPSLIGQKIDMVLMLNPKWGEGLDREAVTAATSFTVVLIRHAEGEMMPISPQLMPLLP